jgi:hypothetical protein
LWLSQWLGSDVVAGAGYLVIGFSLTLDQRIQHTLDSVVLVSRGAVSSITRITAVSGARKPNIPIFRPP